jgi:hypothetical protein
MNAFNDPTLPTELAVVGENKQDPDQLLLLGADGNHYAYSLPSGATQPVEVDDQWMVEVEAEQELFA